MVGPFCCFLFLASSSGLPCGRCHLYVCTLIKGRTSFLRLAKAQPCAVGVSEVSAPIARSRGVFVRRTQNCVTGVYYKFTATVVVDYGRESKRISETI